MNGNTQNEIHLAGRDLLLLCLAAVCVRVPFIFAVPMQEAPDEFSHYWVIKFLHDNMRLPSLAEIAAGGASAVYGSLPQFGYVPHVMLTMLFPAETMTLGMRFGSLCMGLVMIAAAFYAGRLIFKERLLALALPVTLVVHPQLAFLHSYANNDSTSSALSSLIILLMLQVIYTGVTLKRATAIGALVGWTALTKFSALAVIPVVILAILAATVIHSSSWALTLAVLGLIGAMVAAMTGWWFMRNYQEFSGDFMGTKTMYMTWAKLFNREQNYYQPASHILKDFSWWRMLFFSYWGLFGYMTKYLWRPVYIVYGVLFFSAVAGMLRTAYSAGRTALTARGDDGGKVNLLRHWLTVENTAWTSLVLVVVINIVSVIWASMVNLGGPQGRYLFTSEIPIIALIILGLRSLSVRYGGKFVIAFVIWNAVVCVGSFLYLYSMYGGFHPKPY